MPEQHSIGVAQTIPQRGDVPANIAQHVELARRGAELGARILVFPELSLTGYELDLGAQLAFTADDARLAPLSELACSEGLTLVVGAPVHVEGALHIAALAIAPDGRVIVHTKQRLGAFGPEDCPGQCPPPREDAFFTPGTLQPIVSLPQARVAIGICAESLRPSHVRSAIERGADTYLVSHFAIPLDVERRHAFFQSQAKEFAIPIAFASFGGPTAGLKASGRSAIWSPAGKCLVELPETGLGVAVAAKTDGGWVGKHR